MASNVEEIKDRLGIEDVVGSYIKLEKSGANLKARCPFHNEKTPSFYVSPERKSFYCFGCSAKGDIFTFVEKFEGLDFMGALKVLAERAGVSLSKNISQKDNKKEILYEILESATVFFEENLKESNTAKQYVASRGLSEKTISNFRVGYALDDWRTLRNYLKGKGYSDVDMEAVGLIKKTDKPGNDPYYDTFRNRIMFPISDSSGRTVAFTGRTLDENANPPKYLNSPETVLFKKSKILFGLDKAKLDIRKRDYSVLVEGQMDCVMLHQAGYTNVVAASGTAFVEGSGSGNVSGNSGGASDDSAFNLLTRLSDNIVVAFDSDSAGQKAVKRIVPAISLGMNVKIIDIKGGKDPADIVKADSGAWRAVLESKKDFIDYLTDIVLDQKPSHSAIAKIVKQDIFPYIYPIPQETPRYQAIRKVADKLSISENALWKDFEAYAKTLTASSVQKQGIEPEPNKTQKHTRLESIERKILGLLYSKQHLKGNPEKQKELYALAGPERTKFFESLSKETIAELTLEADITYEGTSGESEYKVLMLHLEEEYLRERLAEKMADLQKKEKGKEEEKAREIMKEISQITARIQQVKKLLALI